MKYRITIDSFLDKTDTVSRDQIKNFIVALRDKMQRMSNMETSSIVIQECYHDEGKPCVVLYQWQKA